jgi:hypothetical protein
MGIKLKLSDIDFTRVVGVSTKDPSPGRPRAMVARFLVSIPTADGEGRVLLSNRGGPDRSPIPVLVETGKGRARQRVAEAMGVHGGRPKWFRSAYVVGDDGVVSAPDEKGRMKPTTAHISEATSRWTREDGVTLYTVATPAQEAEFDSRNAEADGASFKEDYFRNERESYASWLSRWGEPTPTPEPVDLAETIAAAVAAAVAAAMPQPAPAPEPVKAPVADEAAIAAMMAKIEELTAALAAAKGGTEGGTEGE